MKLPTIAEKDAENIWKIMAWANFNGDAPVMKSLQSIMSWRTTSWWRHGSSWCMSVDPMNVSRCKHK